MSINLLPDEKVASNTSKFATSFSTVGLRIASLLPVLSVLGLFGAYFYSKSTSDTLEAKINELTLKIEALEPAEQRLFLTKNRLEPVTELKLTSPEESLPKITGVFERVGKITDINEINAESNRIEVLHAASGSADLRLVVSELSKTQTESVTLSSFSYNPFSGYRVGFEIVD